MCGIAGILFSDQTRPLRPGELKAMGDSIAHRGPNAEGFWSAPGIGLAHRRLSIIDIAGGNQPISNEDGSIHVVFNGEIYNHRLLRKGLEERGHRFRTCTDTEVLVHLYEEHGERLVEKLRGMFAFALWDSKQKRLLLARDRVGIKPLYYFQDSQRLLFGSELKAILACADVPRTVDPQALEDYLAFGMVPGPRTIFRQIYKLQPAHLLSIAPGTWHTPPRRYWQLRLEPDHRTTANQWQEALREKLAETVRLHLISDVPVGAFLSGGLDSSATLALASESSGQPLKAFSIGFQEDKFSELPHARQVAKMFGVELHTQMMTAGAVALLDEMARYFDEPFADPAALPIYLLARLASRHVKVALSGDGGDEAFGGYARYAHDLRESAIRDGIPHWFRRGALGPLSAVWPQTDWLPRHLRARSTLANICLDPASAYANTLSLCRRPLRRRLLNPDLRSELNGYDPECLIRGAHAAASRQDPLSGMLAADMATVLPDDFLVKVDRASMASGLEVRTPLLDHELLELAGRIPSQFKVRHGCTKWIFKEACRGRLPDRIIDRPKQGFDIPVDAWLRGRLRETFEDVVLCPRSPAAALIDQETARELYAAHRSRRAGHGRILWGLLALSHWAQRYLPCAVVATDQPTLPSPLLV